MSLPRVGLGGGNGFLYFILSYFVFIFSLGQLPTLPRGSAVAMDFFSAALVDGQVACIECVLYRICSLYCKMDFFSSVSWNFFFIVTILRH